MITIVRILISIVLFLLSLNTFAQQTTELKKVKILNLGVFHMGETPDAYKTDYDEEAKKSKLEIKELVNKIAKFKPTIILLESSPKNNELIAKEYKKYIKNPNYKTAFAGSEHQILGFEIGRLCNTPKIYGIDHKIEYKYIFNELAKKEKAETYLKLKQSIFNNPLIIQEPKKLIDKIKRINSEEYRDLAITANADHLAFVSSQDGFEGADEAAKYYKRNLRMYANINKVKKAPEDRILIISGGSHAAFFNMFMQRSLVYDLVDVNKYLN